MIGLINAVALLHQFQRDRDSEGRVIATLEDYDLVRKYFTDPIARGIGATLTAGADNLLTTIENKYTVSDQFTVHDLKEETGLSKILYDRIRELREHGLVKVAEAGSGNVATKYALCPYSGSPQHFELPNLKN